LRTAEDRRRTERRLGVGHDDPGLDVFRSLLASKVIAWTDVVKRTDASRRGGLRGLSRAEAHATTARRVGRCGELQEWQ
jgi:hypothetical protein